MSKIRIALLGWPDSVHIRNWAEGLLERGFVVQVIGTGRGPAGEADTVALSGRGKLASLINIGPARRAVESFSPDIVHAHYASTFGPWIIGQKHWRSVLSVWGSDVLRFPSGYLKRALIKRVFNFARVITASSRHLMQAAVAIDARVEKKVRIIPFGVPACDDPQPFPEGPPFRVCCLKRHFDVYGQDILVKAVAEVRSRGVDIHLSLPGEGTETEYLRELAARLNLSERISFDGWLKRPQVYPFISQHHVMALPSRSEGFGVSALEASACGRPVVASDVGGLAEAVVPGETGLLVEPESVTALASALEELAADSQRMLAMGEAGRAFVDENYLWSRSLDAMCELYEEILD